MHFVGKVCKAAEQRICAPLLETVRSRALHTLGSHSAHPGGDGLGREKVVNHLVFQVRHILR